MEKKIVAVKKAAVEFFFPVGSDWEWQLRLVDGLSLEGITYSFKATSSGWWNRDCLIPGYSRRIVWRHKGEEGLVLVRQVFQRAREARFEVISLPEFRAFIRDQERELGLYDPVATLKYGWHSRLARGAEKAIFLIAE